MGNFSNIQNLIRAVGNIVFSLIPILIGVALVVFFWGLVKYIRSSGKGHAEGKNIMIAGIVALFIMASIWGIIKFAQDATGIQGNNNYIVAPPAVGVPALR